MASYTGMLLTNKGRDLQAKAEAGTTLSFTKVKIGDGVLGSGQTLEALNDLVNPLKTLSITGVGAESGGLCRITSSITNEGVTEGFYVREVGLFATDPDLGEILYAVTTATVSDYLPPEGGATLVNNQFDLIVVVGNASSITATISNTGFVSQADFNDHLTDYTNPHQVTAEQVGAVPIYIQTDTTAPADTSKICIAFINNEPHYWSVSGAAWIPFRSYAS